MTASHSNPCLIVSDLDGTLLGAHSRFDDNAGKRLKRLLQSGFPLTFATARGLRSTQNLFEDIQVPLPVILQDGLYTAELSTGRMIECGNFISDVTVSAILDRLQDPDAGFFIHTFREQEQTFFRPGPRRGFQQHLLTLQAHFQLTEWSPGNLEAGRRVAGFTVIGPDQAIQKIHRKMEPFGGSAFNIHWSPDAIFPGESWLQLVHPNADKGSMALRLADRLGVEKNSVWTFGDYLNDRTLMTLAGKSHAVSTAHPEIIALADEVIDVSEDWALLSYLEKLAELNRPSTRPE